MKKMTLCLMLILTLIFPGIVLATDVSTEILEQADVAQIADTKYATLEEAVEVANNATEATITLLNNVVLENIISITGNVIIDLNGFTISPDENISRVDGTVKHNALMIVTNGGTLTVNDETGKGKIAVENIEQLYTAIQVTKKGQYDETKTAKLVVNGGTIEGYYYGISGNGKRHNTEIIINGGTIKCKPLDGAGIFHPQSGKVTVKGGTIEGPTGIEMRAGELVVEDGTIKGIGVPTEFKPNGSGNSTYGAGIGLAQHTTGLETKVEVKGGTIQGHTAFYQKNSQNNDEQEVAKVSIAISGGKFETIKGGTVSVESENKSEFITGGTFSSDVTNYIAPYYVCNQVDSNYIVQKLHDIEVKVTTGGKVATDVIRAYEGRKVGLTITPDEGYEVKEVKIIDASEKATVITEEYFTMPNSAVTVEATFAKIVKQEVVVPDVLEKDEKVEDILLDSLKKDEDFKEVIENNNVEVKVEVSEDKVEETVKEEIEEKLEKEEITVGKYFDITIAVKNKDTGATEGTIDELTEEIKFTIEIPEDIRAEKVAEGFARKYFIIRNHEGEIEYLDVVVSEDGKSLSFETDKFSTYVLAYKDEEITGEGDIIQQPEEEPEQPEEEPEQPEEEPEQPEEEPEQPKEEIEEEVKTETTTQPNVPNTGDNIGLYVLLAIVALSGIIVIKKSNTKKSKK